MDRHGEIIVDPSMLLGSALTVLDPAAAGVKAEVLTTSRLRNSKATILGQKGNLHFDYQLAFARLRIPAFCPDMLDVMRLLCYVLKLNHPIPISGDQAAPWTRRAARLYRHTVLLLPVRHGTAAPPDVFRGRAARGRDRKKVILVTGKLSTCSRHSPQHLAY